MVWEVETESGLTGIRCSTLARDQELDPVGSAGSYDAFLLVEHPLPWASDFVESPGLEGLGDLVRRRAEVGVRVRVQGLLAPSTRNAATRTVVLYERPAGTFDGFRSRELVVPVGEAVEAGRDLLEGQRGAESVPNQDATDARDVLLCTHGTRDRCCGSQGTLLHRSVERPAGPARLWRTSHTGGHRYAPTGFSFPEGVGWAYLDEETLAAVLERSDGVEPLISRYRGCCGVDGGPVQALERELFARRGWEWLRFRRAGGLVGEVETTDGEHQVFMDAESPTGEQQRWEATVLVTRHVPVGNCGESVESSKKTCPEYAVRNVTRTA